MNLPKFAPFFLLLAVAATPLPAAPEVTVPADAHKVEVKLIEHRIEMPKETTAGKTVFVITNGGEKEHSFALEGPGGVHEKLPGTLDGGQSKTLQVDLKPGTYRVYCPVGEHAMRGMERNLLVK